MATYRQYCPVARAAEILAERWSLLIVRNLLLGATTFTDIAKGVPYMSRSMLIKRLRELEHNGVIVATPKSNGQGSTYALTDAGCDLTGVVEDLAAWAERWVDVRTEHTDPGFALWVWCKVQINRDALPHDRVVVALPLPRRAGRQPAVLAARRRRRCRGLPDRPRRRAGRGSRRPLPCFCRLAPRRPLLE